MTMGTKPRYEVITFRRCGKDWFSVKDFKLRQVYTLSFDEYLANVADFEKEGLVHAKFRRE